MFKKLTGKNPRDFEFAANHVMNDSDVKVFAELVEKDSFLFDFVKQNVAERLAKATNENNWRTVISFLKYYSPSYEDFICSTLARFADEDLTDEMLDLFENGTDDEKTYIAKFFSYIQDPLAIELLKKYSWIGNDYLSTNCANTLAVMKEETSFNEALEKLNSDDEFEKLSAVRFLINYGRKEVLPQLIETMKSSPMAENIAGEIPYLENLFNILDDNFENGLLILNHIINGLGEILGLSQVFDFELYEVLEYLETRSHDSRVAVVLLNAREKFETLTENDEYLFDEDKNTKNEVFDIKKLLTNIDKKLLLSKVNQELKEDSVFVYTALDFATDLNVIRELLKCNNQTIILKTAEVLKSLGNLDDTAKTVALLKVTDENIKSIIRAL
ncbi:hypothetical protein IJZ97_01205 [bacterium]|nr:hypothetical protein [bacterium]